MKKGMWGVGALALVLITGLSVFYRAQVGKKVVTASTSVNGQELPICSVQTGKKQIAYTFELSGTQIGKGQAEQMLQILQQQEIPATFLPLRPGSRTTGVWQYRSVSRDMRYKDWVNRRYAWNR